MLYRTRFSEFKNVWNDISKSSAIGLNLGMPSTHTNTHVPDRSREHSYLHTGKQGNDMTNNPFDCVIKLGVIDV